MELRKCEAITDRWLSEQLRPYGIHSRSIRVGDSVARGYFKKDFSEAFQRYIPRGELESLATESSAGEWTPACDKDEGGIEARMLPGGGTNGRIRSGGLLTGSRVRGERN